MILHDLNLAAQYADEVHIMKNGRTYALGTPNDVFKSEIIEMAFDCPVQIIQHPLHSCPLVIALGGQLSETVSHSSTRTPVRSLGRSEEHTSELQSRGHLVCRLLLEKKKTIEDTNTTHR